MNVLTKRRVKLAGEVAYALALLAITWAIGTADLGFGAIVVPPLMLVAGACYLMCVGG